MAVGSFSAGLSGLNANATYLSVVGNNLANINTVGFKASSVSFADLVSQTVGGTSINPMQVGLGVVTGAISPVFSQGSPENSREATNVAIQGSGFFVISDGTKTAYTRAGNFSFDSSGALVTPDGWRVQGYTEVDPATGAIVTTGQPTEIVIPPGVLREPTATTNIRTMINLDANAVIDPTNPEATTSVEIYDSLGSPHVLTISFDRTGPGAWTYTITVPQIDVTGVAGAPVVLSTGNLTFDGTGILTAPAADIVIPAPATWANGATPVPITWDIFPPPSNTPAITSFASPSATSSTYQNGSAAGQIDNISINAAGEIIATFGAGQTVTLGQLALANFNNPKGLVKMGSNRFGSSQAAGNPNIGIAGTGGRGTIIGSALESSNVDIAQEFTQMILAQRGYQANSRSITVADEILVETLQMKR
ncbi:MAG TPA: flagellar hook protein FlgE [Vicinamibacterales bacterium]